MPAGYYSILDAILAAWTGTGQGGFADTPHTLALQIKRSRLNFS
jgi:hypothetical protein